MRNWSLRTRLTLLLGSVLCLFALLSTVAYLTSSREEDRLETAFSEELGFLSALPSQRALVRQIDIDAEDFLLTRKPDWLTRRRAAVTEFRDFHAKVGQRLTQPAEAAEWKLVGEAFDRYVAAQDDALERARSGRMTRGEAVEMALTKDAVDTLLERIARFGDVGLRRVDAQRRAARTAAFATFGFVLGIGMLGAIALSAAVSRMMLAPILRLRGQAGQWKLGEPWPTTTGDMPREIRELMETMQHMADSLSEQFEREREAGRLKSQLVSGVSHEFNNALSVIHTAHVLLQENDKSPDDAPWHEMLEANIRALSAMASNLLNLGRLESGKFKLDQQRVELTPLLKVTLERLAVIGRRKKLEVKLDLPADLPAVAGDPDALPLVIANLLTNAFKYTPEGGSVTLGATRASGGVEVFVQDTGIGVADEDREKIFSGYYRTEQGKKTAKGFGVGLALSRMVLEAHGSDLALESAPGKGSRFSFVLAAF
jgi:signal transduction histidine kinase